MDRIPPGGSFQHAFYAQVAAQQQQQQQQQQQIRAQAVQHPPPTQIQPYQPSLPVGSEMPDEWGYPPPSTAQVSPNTPRNTQGVVTLPTGSAPRGGAPQSQTHPTAAGAASAPPVPTCRHPNCGHPVIRDERTQELTEYCSLEHMRDAVQRFGFHVCPACKRCPRRSDSRFCGSLCEEWAAQQQRQRQPQQIQSQELLQQQQRHQQRQHWQPSTMGQPSIAPSNSSNSGAVTWSNAARPANNGAWDTSRQGRH